MEKEKLTGYELSRDFFDWCFENPEKVKPTHVSIYMFAIEHCNRLGWKTKFGFPTQMTMDAIGIKNWRTYIKAFNELVEWGFFKLIEKSKNQYSANVIAIVKNTKAHTKALSKASQKHIQKQGKSIVGIDKQLNYITNKLENGNTSHLKDRFEEYSEHMNKQSVIERLAMNAMLGKNIDEVKLITKEFLETCYGDIMEKKNKFQVEQYWLNWVKIEGKAEQAITNQLKKIREWKANNS